jgi:hypothetical protein
VEYFLPKKTMPVNRVVIAAEFRAATDTLGDVYEKLKQLALKATGRRTQLALFTLSAEVYKFYLEAVIQVQVLEKKLFYPFKIETYPDEWYVVHFNAVSEEDNTEEIFGQCVMLKQEIQKTYHGLLSDLSLSTEQKKILQQQLNGLQISFQKLRIDCLRNC